MYGFAGGDEPELTEGPGPDVPDLPSQLGVPARLFAMLSAARDWPDGGFGPPWPAALRGADVAAVCAPHAVDEADHATLVEQVFAFEAEYLVQARTERARRASRPAPSVH